MERKESQLTMDDYWFHVRHQLLQKAKDVVTMYFDYKDEVGVRSLMDERQRSELMQKFTVWQRKLDSFRQSTELSIHLGQILVRLEECVMSEFPEIQTLRGTDDIEDYCMRMNAKNSKSELYSLMLIKQHFVDDIRRTQSEIMTLS